MKRLLLVMLTIGGMSCAVDNGQASPAPGDETTDEPTDPATSTTSTTSADSEVTPDLVQMCNEGVCTLRTQCLAEGRHAGAPCVTAGAVCCF